MDELKALKYFVKVAETGNFTQAANTFTVPASSLSRRIADLEDKLGASLLQRTTRSVQLTEIGEIYYQQVQAILSNLNLANEIVSHYQERPTGELRISSMVAFGELYLLPLLDRFKQQYPDILLDVHLSDELSDLNEDHVDIAIRGGYVPNERIIAKKLMSNDFFPVAAPRYLQQYGTPQHATELSHHKGIYYRTPHGITPWLAKIEGQWQDVSAPALAISNHYHWLLEKILRGEGMALLPPWSVKKYLDSGELQILDIQPQVTTTIQNDFAVYLLYQKQRYQVPKIKVAVDFLLKALFNREEIQKECL